MEWAIAILFGTAAVLLIVSFVKTKQSSQVEQREIDTVYVSLMEEINKLQEQLRNVELDAEITAQEAQIIGIHTKERVLLRELLDLYKRGYTMEGIAEKTQLNEKEVEYLLAPYMAAKSERRKVANDS
ncbi:hypothetical protein M3182_08925 [Mesobacillus maritimus]|mgnify:CR=1 FL=1|uniref:hypothetical protein n=1 Tax=Mesobacillus maritimus TaxID=1643336 RepID=UPI0020405525|nr:hypothetical protein [Mesobacillus maritimus]MCM3585865.1 hypothetical protein [Mesobacillus maritimus]MCM3670627.1 hypothetical protein [Mesobacillus maritimus]